MKKHVNRVNSHAVADDEGIQAQFGVLVDDVKGLARKIGSAATDQLHSLGDRAKQAGDNVGDMVRGSPMKSVLIAAGVGALLGWMMRRR